MVPQPGKTVKAASRSLHCPFGAAALKPKREETPVAFPPLRMRAPCGAYARRGYSKRLTPVMTTMSAGASVWMPWGLVFNFWILSTVSMPSMTRPNTQ